MSEQVFGDMSEEFEFDEEGLVYVDGPLSGWLRRKRDGAWFAYDCQSLIVDRLWHWTLVPAPRKSEDLARVLADAAQTQGGQWLSIIEDRRSTATSTCRAVSMDNNAVLPMLGAKRAR